MPQKDKSSKRATRKDQTERRDTPPFLQETRAAKEHELVIEGVRSLSTPPGEPYNDVSLRPK